MRALICEPACRRVKSYIRRRGNWAAAAAAAHACGMVQQFSYLDAYTHWKTIKFLVQ